LDRYKGIQKAVIKAIELLGQEVFLDKRVLVSLMEDLVPQLVDERDFLSKTYNNEIGQLLYQAYTESEKEKYGEIDFYLSNKCGFNDDWRQIFLFIFSFVFSDTKIIFPDSAVNDKTDSIIKEQNDSNRKEEISYRKKYINFKAELEEVLTDAIVNKNNKLYSITGDLPKSVQKLLKYQEGKGIVKPDKILLVLTVENIFGIQEGIVVMPDYFAFLSKRKVQLINLKNVKDVKTYIHEGGLAIKIMQEDGTIVATSINSRNYNLTPIIDYLMKGNK